MCFAYPLITCVLMFVCTYKFFKFLFRHFIAFDIEGDAYKFFSCQVIGFFVACMHEFHLI